MKNNHKYNKIFDALRQHLYEEYLIETPKKNNNRKQEESLPSTSAKTERTVKFKLSRNKSELIGKKGRLVNTATNTQQHLRGDDAYRFCSAGNLRCENAPENIHHRIRSIRNEVESHYPQPKQKVLPRRSLSSSQLRRIVDRREKSPRKSRATVATSELTAVSHRPSFLHKYLRQDKTPSRNAYQSTTAYYSTAPMREDLAMSILQYQLDRKMALK